MVKLYNSGRRTPVKKGSTSKQEVIQTLLRQQVEENASHATAEQDAPSSPADESAASGGSGPRGPVSKDPRERIRLKRERKQQLEQGRFPEFDASHECVLAFLKSLDLDAQCELVRVPISRVYAELDSEKVSAFELTAKIKSLLNLQESILKGDQPPSAVAVRGPLGFVDLLHSPHAVLSANLLGPLWRFHFRRLKNELHRLQAAAAAACISAASITAGAPEVPPVATPPLAAALEGNPLPRVEAWMAQVVSSLPRTEGGLVYEPWLRQTFFEPAAGAGQGEKGNGEGQLEIERLAALRCFAKAELEQQPHLLEEIAKRMRYAALVAAQANSSLPAHVSNDEHAYDLLEACKEEMVLEAVCRMLYREKVLAAAARLQVRILDSHFLVRCMEQEVARKGGGDDQGQVQLAIWLNDDPLLFDDENLDVEELWSMEILVHALELIFTPDDSSALCPPAHMPPPAMDTEEQGACARHDVTNIDGSLDAPPPCAPAAAETPGSPAGAEPGEGVVGPTAAAVRESAECEGAGAGGILGLDGGRGQDDASPAGAAEAAGLETEAGGEVNEEDHLDFEYDRDKEVGAPRIPSRAFPLARSVRATHARTCVRQAQLAWASPCRWGKEFGQSKQGGIERDG